MPAMTWDELKAQFMQWRGCPLVEQANPVFGHGNPRAEIVFIGEAPGQREDEQGIPFVGPAGKLLDELLASIGLKREDIYITNVVKYRPPANRDPTPEEKRQCLPWLQMEIAIIKPKVLIPLGRHALTQFFTKMSITEAHGKGQRLADGIGVFPLYHPAAALHNPSLRQTLFDDFQALNVFLEEQRSSAQAASAAS
jgi:uracil-DNA glycosylase